MTKIEELQKLIEETEKKLDDRIEFENDGGRDIIIVTDNEAETSDESFLFESYGHYETLEFLENEGYLK